MTRERGYSLIEMLVSMAIMLVVTGAIFRLANPSQATAQVQPEIQDMQQRMRIAADTLFKNLVMAGAGPYQGATTGSLMGFFAPVIPHKTGYLTPDGTRTAYSDRITLTYVPNSYSQTTITDPMPPSSVELKVNRNPGCPGGLDDPDCGFAEGEQVIIFDSTGNYNTFTITNVQDSAKHIQHRGQNWAHQYDSGSVITQVESHMFYRDTTTNQLMHYDGGFGNPVPVADNVVGLRFDYYGDPNPPLTPKPPVGQANCLYDATGAYIATGMTALTAQGGSLASLPLSIFTDGPWCGSDANEFDADLFRVRKIKVTLRIQTPIAALRGQNTTLFVNPGTSRSGQKFIPDLIASFEVSPRNLNLSR
jgi:prepilin-type N-terminal cleavage/methylation domain-containing protein